MRKLEGFKNMDETIKNVQKENWQKELAQIEQRRNDRLPGHVNVVPPISEFGRRRSSPRERNRPGFTSRNCRRRRRMMEKPFKMELRTKWSLSWRLENF